jgi:hypothetical protein
MAYMYDMGEGTEYLGDDLYCPKSTLPRANSNPAAGTGREVALQLELYKPSAATVDRHRQIAWLDLDTLIRKL